MGVLCRSTQALNLWLNIIHDWHSRLRCPCQRGLCIAICVALGKSVKENASTRMVYGNQRNPIYPLLLLQLDSLPSSWLLDPTGLAVLFITFMAQPGPRSSGLFNCNETTIMMLLMNKKKKQMWRLNCWHEETVVVVVAALMTGS